MGKKLILREWIRIETRSSKKFLVCSELEMMEVWIKLVMVALDVTGQIQDTF